MKDSLGHLSSYFRHRKHLPARFARDWIIPPAIWEKVTAARSDTRRPPETRQVSSSNVNLWELRRAPHDNVLWIPIDWMRSQTGVAYTPEQHHGVRFLDEGLGALRQFYDLHNPKNALEANFVFGSKENEHAPTLQAGKPWGTEWDHSNWPTGHPAWGPVSEVFLRAGTQFVFKFLSTMMPMEMNFEFCPLPVNTGLPFWPISAGNTYLCNP